MLGPSLPDRNYPGNAVLEAEVAMPPACDKLSGGISVPSDQQCVSLNSFVLGLNPILQDAMRRRPCR
jgi:hypothetical protein